MTIAKAEDELLRRLKEFTEGFAERLLTEYTARIENSATVSDSPKEINDAVWGTIKLSALEVMILDSPIVQRLRFVRQLGVVHWVYPGATHARFEHTLGVLFQAQQLITAINQASEDSPANPPIDKNRAGLVRLCALLHDIGHGVFSHVSEHALNKRPELSVALARFATSHGLPKVQLSEVVAYFMIGSPAFARLLSTALDRLGQPIHFVHGAAQNAAMIVEKVQHAIVGRMIDEKVPLLHEIITGPFDADKLDYYVRDARMAGVPSLLDISRLTQKITVARIPGRDLPPNIAARVTNKQEDHFLFGLKWSGAPILDELHLARVLLYAKIYRHKKVLAAEAMIDALFDAMGGVPGADLCRLIAVCYEFSDDQLMWSSANTILSAADIGDAPASVVTFVDDVVKRLRDRALFVSALAVRAKYPADPWADDKSQSRGLSNLVGDLSNSQRLRRFQKKLVGDLGSLAAACPDALGGLDASIVEHSVVVSNKPALGGGTEIERAFIFQGQKPILGRDLDLNRINQPAWATAYDFGAPTAIIFCPRECAAAVYVAAERLIRLEYEVVLPASALDLSKQDPAIVTTLKRQAEAAGWYAGTPLDIRPLPARLSMHDVSGRIDAVAAKLQAFDEPKLIVGQRRATGLRERIESWLAQFRDDDMIDLALTMLERLRILRREDSHATLVRFVESHPQFKGATICPLGALKDSGAVQAYISRDLETIFPRTSTVEEAAAANYDAPIVFLDDFTASGSQALDILGNWFDDPDLIKDELGEERLPFGDAEKAYLKSRPIAFVFVAGWSDGLARIRSAVAKLGLDAIVHAHLEDDQIPFAFDPAAEGDAGDQQRFKSRCEEIGRDLLASHDKDAAKQRERALGYGNRAMLLTSSLNVPTQNLLCLWMEGQVAGVDWHALLRRRAKA